MDKKELVPQTEDLVYQSLYAPTDLQEMLATAENRGRIRRLPVPHLFYGLKNLDPEGIEKLLPHITEEQWAGILDLDLWTRDQASVEDFLYWLRHLRSAEDAVARKLLRATDPELWEFTFKREMQIHFKLEEDEYEAEPREGEWLETPDKHYLVRLPENLEKARLLRGLLLRLYELDSDFAANLLKSCRARTSVEMEETAYQNRKGRVEGMGFQDYFEALEIYAFLPPEEALPEKKWDTVREISTLPVTLPKQQDAPLLFQALTLVTRPQESQFLLEELFFVCNKVLSADSVSPARPDEVRKCIRKAVSGMNLGLDWWAEGNLQKAVEGVRRHYLQSFFQVGHSRLIALQQKARTLISAASEAEAGSLLEAVVEAVLEPYPLFAEQREGKIRKRFFRTRMDLDQTQEYLEPLAQRQCLE